MAAPINGSCELSNCYMTPRGNDTNTMADVSAVRPVWAMMTLLVVIGCSGVGNLLVCLAVCWERQLQNMTNYFLMSLAIADFLVSILVMPLGMMVEMYRGSFPLMAELCVLWATMDVLLCTASIWHMSTMSMDRFFTLKYPMRYGRNKTKTTVFVRILFVWLLSVAISSPVCINGFLDKRKVYSDGFCVIQMKEFIIYGSVCAFYIPLVIMIITYILTLRILCNNQKLMNRLEYCNVQTKLCKINRKLNSSCLFPCIDDSSRFTIPDSTITEDISKSTRSCNDFTMGINPEEKSRNNSIDIVGYAEHGPSRKSVGQKAPSYLRIDTFSPKDQKYRATKTTTMKGLHEREWKHKRISKSQTNKQTEHFQIQLNLCAVSDFLEISDSFNSSPKSRHMVESYDSLNTMTMWDDSMNAAPMQDIPFSTASRDDMPLRRPTCDDQLYSTPSRQHHPPNPTSHQHHPPNPASRQHHPPNPASHQHHSPNPSNHQHHPLNPASRQHHPPKPARRQNYPPNPTSYQHHQPNPPSGQHHPPNPVSHQHHPLISAFEPDPISAASPQKHCITATETLESEPRNTAQIEKRTRSTDALQKHSFSTNTLQKHSFSTDELQRHSSTTNVLQKHSSSTGALQKHSLSSDALQKHVLKDSLIKSCEQIEQEMDLCLKDAEQTSEHPEDGDLDTSWREFQCTSIPHIVIPSLSSSSSLSSVNSNESTHVDHSALMPKSEQATTNSLTQGLYMYKLNYEEAASNGEAEPLVRARDDDAQTRRTIPLQPDVRDNTELPSNQHEFKRAIKHILSKKTASNERKASKVLGIIFAVFVVLWTPFFTVNILTAMCPPCQMGITQEMMSAFLWMGYVASLANPIIYTMFNTAFRKAFYKIITCKYRRSRLHTPDSMMMTYAAMWQSDRRNTVTMYIKDDTRA